jgi:hypothetical protein
MGNAWRVRIGGRGRRQLAVAAKAEHLMMSDVSTPERAGLCASCVNAAVISSSKGSTFYLCRLSETDPCFRRYPVLPVRACSGYQPAQ